MIEGVFGSGIRWVFTDRFGGLSPPPYDELNLATHVGDDPSHVALNRIVAARRLLGGGQATATVPAPRVVAMRAVHGASVGIVDEQTRGDVDDVDALVSQCPDVVLLGLAADCVPIVMADPAADVVAVVHAGWRGLVAGVAPRALDALCDLGARMDRIECVLGPCICGHCYTVDRGRYERVVQFAPGAAGRGSAAAPSLDIRRGLRDQLVAAGATVSVVGPCTQESPEYYSYRRDGVTGRQGALIVRTSGAAESP